MSELKEQWTSVDRTAMDGGTAWVLKETSGRWNWAHIQRDQILAEWELRIWDGGGWEKPIYVKSLREAKNVGRLLAGIALNKIF